MLHSAGFSSGAEDLVQITFLRAFKAIDSFEGTAQLSTWLYRILCNNFKNFLRTPVNRNAKFNAEDLQYTTFKDVELAVHDDDNKASFHELEHLFQTAFQILTGHQKLVFLLCVMEELKYSEAAQRLGLNETQVRGHLFRARRHLRRALVDFLPER
jgi:RNA polymerase sigma-70 factor (ECF subfamily)